VQAGQVQYERVLALRYHRNGTAIAMPLGPSSIFIPVDGITQSDQHVRMLVDGVMQLMSSRCQKEVQAWEEEISPCEHMLTLHQLTTGHIPVASVCAPFFSYLCNLN
jgi:hypothetical protein